MPAPARFVDLAEAAHAGRICALAEHLGASDRAVLLLAYAEGKSIPQIAALIGGTRHGVQRRLTRLTRRVLAPEFAFAAGRLGELDGVARAVAKACIIEGRSVRATATHLKMSQHAVRAARDALVVMARASGGNK